MKKRICFAITSITNNGVTRVVSILLDEIDYTKYDVTVLLTRKTRRIGELNPNARIIEASNDIGSGIAGKLSAIKDIRRILKSENFEIIIALGDYAALYTLLAGVGLKVKKIVSERNDPNREPGKKLFRILRDLLYRNVDAIICQTMDSAEYFRGITKKRIVIHNPVRADLPTTEGVVREKRIVNFCRIDGQKNLPLLIDAFRDFASVHPGFTLDIYGNGPDEEKIREYINQKRMSALVHMHDFCFDVHEKIRSAYMFVSSSDFEGMSNSMLEAMAIGIPTICTDCPIGGAHEIIESGVNGILVPVCDRKAMVEAMNRVADDEKLAKKLSMNGMRVRDTLSKTVICRQWCDVIDSLTDK
ncbi:MAG: glycosyltransferase [Clostridia bacterium]|nr:glycosyltransferase [Clostridia bacterium]